jgi:hypothetical protein
MRREQATAKMWNKLKIMEKPGFGKQAAQGGDEFYYSYDGKTVLCREYPVTTIVDVETFVHKFYFAKDKNKCYLSGSPCKNSDTETFEALNIYFAKDKNNIYTRHGIVKNIDHATFEVLDCGYSTDSEGKLHEVLSYCKDKSGIWFMDYYSHKPVLLKESDIQTFHKIDDVYAKDIKQVYWRGKRIPKADPDTFVPLNCNYGKDERHIYCHNKMMTAADYSTFRVKNTENPTYAMDKNNAYYLDEITTNEDHD